MEKIEFMWLNPDLFHYQNIAEDAQKRYTFERYYKELIEIYN